MKKIDIPFVLVFLALIGLALMPGNIDAFKAWTKEWPYLSSFIKFAVLSGFGESLALRFKTGSYNRPGFGLLTRSLVWGVLGMGIKAAFIVFSSGALPLLKSFGIATQSDGAFSLISVLVAFTISLTMNVTWAPVMMMLHKISDSHISHTGGSLVRYLTTRPDVVALIREIDWKVMWGFVYKKTLVFWWIPAHTVTFLLPPYLQILFAAMLGIVLGVILSLAAQSTEGNGSTDKATAC